MGEADELSCLSCSHLESQHCEGLARETGFMNAIFLPADSPLHYYYFLQTRHVHVFRV